MNHPHHYQDWVGREQHSSETIDLRTARLMAATLDLDPNQFEQGSELLPLWHWVYFVPDTPTAGLGADGHPKRGGFLPPVTLENRMWAGGRLTFHQPLCVGQKASRLSRIARCETKQGRSGPLVFVTVQHTIQNDSGICLVEEQDLVYRNPAPRSSQKASKAASTTSAKAAEPTQADHCKQASGYYCAEAKADSVLLFRYSALTFNSHRIHYDHLYVTETEGYPGLIVHGALLATMMMHQLRGQFADHFVKSFSFKAVGPIYVGQNFQICGKLADSELQQDTETKSEKTLELWIEKGGKQTMTGQAVIATSEKNDR